MFLQINNMPKTNRLQFDMMRVLGSREKKEFKPHSIKELMDEFDKYEGEFPEKVKNIKVYLDSLDIKEIVTPCHKITDFIHEDLIATNPSFLAEVVPTLKRLDYEIKKINNTEVKGNKNLMKYIVVALCIGLVIAGVAIANDKGVFKPLTDVGKGIQDIQKSGVGLPPIGGGFSGAPVGTDYSDAAIQARYPTPELLKAAIAKGEVNYNSLSQFAKDSIDSLQEAVTP